MSTELGDEVTPAGVEGDARDHLLSSPFFFPRDKSRQTLGRKFRDHSKVQKATTNSMTAAIFKTSQGRGKSHFVE